MLQMDQAPGLNHILGKWRSLAALQDAMRRAGVNMFVSEYSDKYVTISAKVIMLTCFYSRVMERFKELKVKNQRVVSLGSADRACSV